MSLFSKVITVSEIEEVSVEIGKLFSESAAYTGLIEDTVEDLKLSNAKVLEERKAVENLIKTLKTKEAELVDLYEKNKILIDKLDTALAEEGEKEEEK